MKPALTLLLVLQFAGLALCIQIPSRPSSSEDQDDVDSTASRHLSSFLPPLEAMQAHKANLIKAVQTQKAPSQTHHVREIAVPSSPPANGQMNIQVGDNYTEMQQIDAELNTILADLLAQDNADDLLLSQKTSNHTDAIAATAFANASLATAQADLQNAQTTYANEQATLVTTTSEANEKIAHSNSELTYATTMETALNNLEAVGVNPEQLIALGNMASKMSSVHTSEIENFKQSLSFIQRPYTETSGVQASIDNLKAAINQNKADAQQTIVDQQAVVDAANAAVQAASANVVVMQTRQTVAIANEYAALQDLITTTADVAASKAETQQVRDAVLQIKQELTDMGNIEETDTSFLQIHKFMEMLDMGVQRYAAIISRIQSHILMIMGTIDNEEVSEQAAKMNRMSVWNALRAAEPPLIEESNVKTAALNTLDSNIAQAQGVLDGANAALQLELDAQLREQAFFGQLRTLITSLPGQEGESGETLIQMSREHTSFVQQFNDLISAIEATNTNTKSSLELARDNDANAHATLVNSRLQVALEAEQAETAEQNAISATAAALAVYNTASARYMANYALRTEERTILIRLQGLVANLGN